MSKGFHEAVNILLTYCSLLDTLHGFFLCCLSVERVLLNQAFPCDKGSTIGTHQLGNVRWNIVILLDIEIYIYPILSTNITFIKFRMDESGSYCRYSVVILSFKYRSVQSNQVK